MPCIKRVDHFTTSCGYLIHRKSVEEFTSVQNKYPINGNGNNIIIVILTIILSFVFAFLSSSGTTTTTMTTKRKKITKQENV